jgi:4-amino-4-deoxy-L-arabinose transferase-like glycosyltransferase
MATITTDKMNAARLLSTTLLVLLVIAFCLQALLALPRLSATSDEPIHLSAGYSYWQTRDFRLNPEHPPLAKLIAALPLLIIRPTLDMTHDDWKRPVQEILGFRFLYGNDADRLLFWSRTAMILLSAVGLIVTFLWARDLFGAQAGLFAATMYAFSPNLLAHGMLVTTDVPLAVFTVLTFYLFWKGGETGSWRIDVATGLALGAAMASKFSGVFLPVLILIFCIARDRRAAFVRLITIAVASLVVIEAAYLFSATPLLYFRNAALVNANHVQNYPVYLLGRLKPGGWWYYFPAAFLFKATVPTLAMIIFAVIHAISDRFASRWGEIILITGICFYALLISWGADQIGLRYLLPIFPLLFVWTSRVVPWILSMRGGALVIGALLAWQAFSAVRTFPNYIPYFNELAGGPAQGPWLLDDSNIDWGQGIKQAAQYVREHHIDSVHMHTFSPIDNLQYYGLPPDMPFPEAFRRLVARTPAPGVYIISAHYVARMRGVSRDWQTYVPVDRIGNSLWVYRF